MPNTNGVHRASSGLSAHSRSSTVTAVMFDHS